MRDLDTISTAISAAETGHLVLSTLHTTDAAQTVDRIIDVFPQGQQQQIRLQVSQAIEAIISQALLPLAAGKGRIAAFEIMIANPAVRNLIRDERTFELHNVMQLCSAEGMRTLDEALATLVKEHKVTLEEALVKSSNQQQLKGYAGVNKM
jgi:twitching motility protein PilT